MPARWTCTGLQTSASSWCRSCPMRRSSSSARSLRAKRVAARSQSKCFEAAHRAVLVRIFYADSRIQQAERDEGLEVFGCPEYVHSESRCRWDASCGYLPPYVRPFAPTIGLRKHGASLARCRLSGCYACRGVPCTRLKWLWWRLSTRRGPEASRDEADYPRARRIAIGLA